MVTEQLAKATDTEQMGTVTLFTKNSKAFENDKRSHYGWHATCLHI
jgi:hypothetical protein